jgi:hypothetical protein
VKGGGSRRGGREREGKIGLGVDKFFVVGIGAHIIRSMGGSGSGSRNLRMERGSVGADGDPGRRGGRCGVRKGGLREGGGCRPTLSFWREGNGRAVLLKERSESSRESGIVG